jgi:subtilisin family serine protease
MIKIKLPKNLPLQLEGKQKKIIIGVLVLLFLLVLPRFVNQGIQASPFAITKERGIAFPANGDSQEVARILKKMLNQAEDEAVKEREKTTAEEEKSEDIDIESASTGGEKVIYLGKSPKQAQSAQRLKRDNSKPSQAVVVAKDDKKDNPGEEAAGPDANKAKEESPLFLPPGAGGKGDGGGLIPPSPGQPGAPGQPGLSPRPSPKPPVPPTPFKWRLAKDPNRPNSEKIKLTDAQPARLTVEEMVESEYKPGEIIVKFKESVSPSSVMAEVMSLDTTVVYEVSDIFAGHERLGNSTYLFNIDKEADLAEVLKELSEDPAVEYVHPNYLYNILKTPNDPMYHQLWGMQKIQADKAWDKSEGSAEVIVGVSDTGVDGNHPDLKDNLVAGKSFVGSSPTTDRVSHGTHVAGTIAAVGNNGIGVIGVAPKVKIMPLKISDSPSISDSIAAQSLTYAADNGVKVLNMSWGGPSVSSTLQQAVSYAYGKDVVLVAAAGNSGAPPVMYPAAFPEVIAVSATDSNDRLADFSSYGAQVEVSAPGAGILSSVPGGSYDVKSGTSMAAPHASGVVALIRSVFPGLKNEEVRKRLTESVDDLGQPGRDEQFGYGRINAYKAIKDGVNPSPTPTPSPTPGAGWPWKPPGYLTSSLKVGDIDGNGTEELIFVTTNEYKENYTESQLYVLTGEGKVMDGYPVTYEDRGWVSPALADMNDDGVLDIVVTGESLGEQAEPSVSEENNILFSLQEKDQRIVIISFVPPFRSPGSPAIYDINDDGTQEVVVAYLDGTKVSAGLIEQKIFVADFSQDKPQIIDYRPKIKLVYKAVENGFIQACSPIVDDLNNDGKVEIVLGDALDESTGKLYLLVALDSEGNVVAKVENPTGNVSLYSRMVAVKNMYKKDETAILLVRATETKDEIYVVDLFGGKILSPWPKEVGQPFKLYDPVPLNIDGDGNWEFAVRGEGDIPLYHHEGSIAQGFPVKDSGGNIRAIRSDEGKKDLLVANAIYEEGGKKVADFTNISKGGFVMDQAIGRFVGSDKEGIILLIVDKDGKEYLTSDVLPETDTEEFSPWPMYRKLADNRGITEVGAPAPSPSPSPTPGTNQAPQIGQITDKNMTPDGWLYFNFSVTDPEGDSFTVKGEGLDPNFDPWKQNPVPTVTNGSFSWWLMNVPVGDYPVRITATDSPTDGRPPATGKKEFTIKVR